MLHAKQNIFLFGHLHFFIFDFYYIWFKNITD
jgi:hypothetical protein